MAVRISSPLLARLLAEAAALPSAEICGLLTGSETAIADAIPAANVAADPTTGFEIDPRALFAQHRRERDGGPRAIGHYHSHPNGRPEPSRRDAEAAAGPPRLWLILAGTRATLWRSGESGGLHGCFAPVALDAT